MQNFTAKIDGKVVEVKTLSEKDLEKIRGKLDMIHLESTPTSTEELKPGVLYSFPAPDSGSAI